MSPSDISRRVFWAAQLLLIAGTAAAAVALGRTQEWHPVTLVVPLLLLALVGQWFSVSIRGGGLSASLVAIVLAMGLLGPVPAAACGIAAMVFTSALRRVSANNWLFNLSSYAAIPFIGGLIVLLAVEATGTGSAKDAAHTLSLGLILFGAFVVATALSFLLFSLNNSINEGIPLGREVRELVPVLPGELAAGVLAVLLAVAYIGIGPPALFAALVVLLIVQRLTAALLRSEDRAEALLARSRQLVGLQLGVLRTLVRALAMRDRRTARHAAAVARYAKALAAEIGCDEDEQDMIHTAGLLHDIGKFTWPDRLLHAEAFDERDYESVRRHPQEGSILVGALDGYGEVADAILYHHERIDGRGYPAGLIAGEIPLGSRVVAICSNYDAMTAPDSYRKPMSPEEAITELRRSAEAGQLDGELVEHFIAVLEREGPTFAQDADFETELEFERRVSQLAQTPEQTSPEQAISVHRDLLAGLTQLGQRAVSKR